MSVETVALRSDISSQRFKRLGSYLRSRAEDWLLNVDTGGTAASYRPGAVYYATIGYPAIREALKRLNLQSNDIFVDVGAGKGRVLCIAARKQLRQVVGVECSSELADIARYNCSRLRGRKAPVEVCALPAEEFDYSSATALYFFNPFEAQILDMVLNKIKVDSRRTSIRLAFIMESEAQREVFRSHDWLTCRQRWHGLGGHPSALYGSA